MRIVFLGPPGAGKGTQAERLKEYLDIAHLSTGEIFRQAAQAGTSLGREAARYMQAGQLVPDELVVGIVIERITQKDCQQGCLFDGFPRTLPQARALDETLGELGIPLDMVLALDVPESVLVERLLARGRADDSQQAIQERLRQYALLTEPLFEYYSQRGILRMIDGEGSPADVFARIKDAVDVALH